MSVQLHVIPNTVTEIAFQDASSDIWDTKYRLKTKDGVAIDANIDETYQRVAKALSEVEIGKANQEKYYKEFLWALRNGAIPAGRIISNAGALAHKPATSTINCTVSGNIIDSMDDILAKVHEAGLTLKAGCVAPDTLVCTEKGYVTAQQAVTEQHEQILSYDRESCCFEMRPILKHLTTHVPQHENIEICSHLGKLITSIKHPVLVFRNEKLQYVRADEVNATDALIHYQLLWQANKKMALTAWFAGAHLGDGTAYEKHKIYSPLRQKWQLQAAAYGKLLVFKIRAAEREVVERYAYFFQQFCDCQAKVVATVTPNNTPVWDFTVSSFQASAASALFDHQIGKKSHSLKVPQWIKQAPDHYFLPFLAGLIDTDGTINTEHGSAILSCQNAAFAHEIQSLLALFSVHGAITHRKPRSHTYNGKHIHDCGGYCVKISDSDFLIKVAHFMADSGKKNRIQNHQTQAGQYDYYVMSAALRQALSELATTLTHVEKQEQGIYHGKHLQATISRVYLNRWATAFPQLQTHIDFVRQLRPVKAIKRDLDMGDTFYDFTVDKNNNYLAGNNALTVIHNCGTGYNFSTLRPKGAYVSGAGAFTSGPLSFMDIYDKMCFTVSSAGGRRGAQMATFDVGHPDVIEFIRAKREDGRLRQFNLSLLITAEFMNAVKNDQPWHLSFPVTEKEVKLDKLDLSDSKQIIWRDLPRQDGYIVNNDGLVACKINKTMPAKRLWDIIMSSTYDYAEPGFILIDNVNEMNNNWFCEKITATNPCVAEGTLVQTPDGLKAVETLKIGDTISTILGQGQIEKIEIHENMPVKRVCFENGVELRVTDGHIFHKAEGNNFNIETRFNQLKVGDEIRVFNGLTSANEVLTTTIRSIEPAGMATVYDLYEPVSDTWITEGIVNRGCGEQALPPYGSCLLGSINLTRFVKKPFTNDAHFDWDTYRKVIRSFTRMLDNVVEINGLPLPQQREEIMSKRRHGMGYLGLGSTITMLGMKYGDDDSVQFTEEVTKTLAIEGWKVALSLAQEKGAAPVMEQDFTITGEMLHKRPEMIADGYKIGDVVKGKVLHAKYSRYMQKIAEVEPELVAQLIETGARFTHHSSIAPTGCVVPDTLIVTDKGVQKIQELGDINGEQWQDVNFQVATDTGFKQATQFFVNGKAETVKITTTYGRTIEATGNHQIKVICPESGYVWKKLDAIQHGDVIPSLVNNYPASIKVPKTLNIELNSDETHYHNRGGFSNPDYLTADIALFVGFLHANGNVKTERHIRLYHHVDYAEQTFSKITEIVKAQFNLDCAEKQLEGEKYAKLRELDIHSLHLVSWLEKNGLSKTSSTTITVPQLIRLGGRDIINAYLKGLFEGDGSISKNAIALSSVSEIFISELQVIMQSVGIVARKDISVKADAEGHKGDKDVHRLSVNHFIDKKRFIENIGFISNKGDVVIESSRNENRRQLKGSILEKIGLAFGRSTPPAIFNQIDVFQSTLSDEIFFEEVAAIETGFSDTYDLSVPENVTYTANNLVSHNTISLSLANNASNGIEPSFAHHYSRNVIRTGKKSKEKIDVFSFELLAYREMVNPHAVPYSDKPEAQLPDYFIAADDVTPTQHVDIQAAAQKWIDSSISKTANVPTDFPYEDFKSIYEYAYDQGLKGCTTFRFNPEVFQGVLVKTTDLENTTYQFTLEDGEVIEVKGNEEIEYDGEIHSAANLFDALKEGYYGKF